MFAALKRIKPSQRLLWLLLGWAMAALIPIWWPQATVIWLLGGAMLALIAFADARRKLPDLRSERFVAPILAVDVWSDVRVRIHSNTRRILNCIVFDHYPQPAQLAGLPQALQIKPGAWSEFHYRLRPLARGEVNFAELQLLIESPLGLWQRSIRVGASQPVKVYPNFATIAKFALLAHDRRVSAMGVHQQRRRGEGQDFYQLREYREGDTLRQVDWKATARHRKLISKEYQDERDQPIVFLLDCSRRMRTRDGLLSHFDHALNALILLSYVALRQGDAVGVQSFGGVGMARWRPAKKGAGFLKQVINTVYDLQPTLGPADYSVAANQLLRRQRKRALVIVLTNLRDDDSSELLPAMRLLRQRHLVLLANLRESALDDLIQQPINDFRQARLHGSLQHYLAEREYCQEAVRRQGTIVLDTTPQQLPIALVNHYLDIKRSGRL